MSYISPLSCPEQLKVWSDISGWVIWVSALDPDRTMRAMPREVMDALGAAYHSWDHEEEDGFEYNGGYIKVVESYKIRVGFEDWFFDLYEVTAAYIFRRYERVMP